MDDNTYLEFMKKYIPSEVDELKNKIRMARFSYIITDPYPELSQWQQNQKFKSYIESKTDIILNRDPKPEVSAHKAYRDGMEFMWSLIEPLVK
jgi:hypothetical protein